MKRKSTRAVLRQRNLAPKKRFGQNFLVNENTVRAIINSAAPDPQATIVELGVGLGAMTIPLARQVKKVIGIEIDAGLVRMHRETGDLPGNVTLIHDDLLAVDFKELAGQCGGRLPIIANLPYSISNPLLFKLLDNHDIMDYAVLMLQKEVGDRLAARPKTKEYGVLSVLVPAYATVKQLMRIGPEQFHPRPRVDSVVVKIDFSRTGAGQTGEFDFPLLKKIVKGAFGQRRKTLVNSLYAAKIMEGGKEEITAVLEEAGVLPTARADQLDTGQYLAITRAVATR